MMPRITLIMLAARPKLDQSPKILFTSCTVGCGWAREVSCSTIKVICYMLWYKPVCNRGYLAFSHPRHDGCVGSSHWLDCHCHLKCTPRLRSLQKYVEFRRKDPPITTSRHTGLMRRRVICKKYTTTELLHCSSRLSTMQGKVYSSVRIRIRGGRRVIFWSKFSGKLFKSVSKCSLVF